MTKKNRRTNVQRLRAEDVPPGDTVYHVVTFKIVIDFDDVVISPAR